MDSPTEKTWKLFQLGWDTAYAFSYHPDQRQPYRAACRDGLGGISAPTRMNWTGSRCCTIPLTRSAGISAVSDRNQRSNRPLPQTR